MLDGATTNNYTWILLVGMVVFFFVIFILLCFTKASGERLFYSGEDSFYEDTNYIVETPALLATLSEDARISYEQAKLFQQRHPPDSIPTDITLSQYVSIQEKGVSAFEFEWEMETQSFVSARTEIQFFSGESCVQTNLPLPKNQEVYYWEAKMFEKPLSTVVSVGVATKPYPYWRLPGWNNYSIGYFSNTGHKHFNNPFIGKPYGYPYEEGDVIGVGYRHRTGTVFFTKNGRKLDEACFGLRYNLFPTIGANGPCQVHVNFGQMGFVFVEANVKKWGLAPVQGTLAPPPAYGFEAGSLLLETGSAALTNSADGGRTPYNGHNHSTFVGETSYLLSGRGTRNQHSIRSYQSTNLQHQQILSSFVQLRNTASLCDDTNNSDDDDDDTPLIHHVRRQTATSPTAIAIPSDPQEGITPYYSPPSYSTLPRITSYMKRHHYF
ncbi:concanavalin A-like lectin/glucanase domain-containing protein [Mycotypha africana]|uniref:concanavalin A-like lectin/glucanase domain-containing protein n=1 Tax=Mycotypha africana TaxID=64632 RepID=UPI002301E008|nr:concanavalin A-like lectin/glucanase domain-containing protein [Mycotypha africana]KAI8970408.1 concanavalin A-like lectin/glucanase domain-containing protein [Mycotypha africana]